MCRYQTGLYESRKQWQVDRKEENQPDSLLEQKWGSDLSWPASFWVLQAPSLTGRVSHLMIQVWKATLAEQTIFMLFFDFRRGGHVCWVLRSPSSGCVLSHGVRLLRLLHSWELQTGFRIQGCGQHLYIRKDSSLQRWDLGKTCHHWRGWGVCLFEQTFKY